MNQSTATTLVWIGFCLVVAGAALVVIAIFSQLKK
jgi:hypothetical protein